MIVLSLCVAPAYGMFTVLSGGSGEIMEFLNLAAAWFLEIMAKTI